MENILTTLQDKVYELEGLVMLAGERADRRDALIPLLKAKIAEISECGGNLHVGKEAECGGCLPVGEDAEYADAPEADDDSELYSIADSADDSAAKRREPVFCINDRFRFKRELFHNSDAEFAEMLRRVASMRDYEEAESYFIYQAGLDPESETTADFLEILKTYYE